MEDYGGFYIDLYNPNAVCGSNFNGDGRGCTLDGLLFGNGWGVGEDFVATGDGEGSFHSDFPYVEDLRWRD